MLAGFISSFTISLVYLVLLYEHFRPLPNP